MRALVLGVLLAGCRKEAPPSPAPPSPTPAPSASAAPATSVSPLDPLSIVLDGKGSTLPTRATDPGKPFDRDLRDKVAPHATGPIRQGPVTVDHGLPWQVVQRIVRQNFGRFRLCYTKATAASPDLAGTLTIAFTIDAAGDPKQIVRSGAGIASDALATCVLAAFGGLSFPQPEGGGEAHVVYGLEFSHDS